MLTDKEVEHIAKLARIQLSPELQESVKKDLSVVLGYIALLDEADTSGISPLYQVTGLQNQMRSDEAGRPLVSVEDTDKLLIGAAPHQEDRYVKVKSVKQK